MMDVPTRRSNASIKVVNLLSCAPRGIKSTATGPAVATTTRRTNEILQHETDMAILVSASVV